MARQHGGVRNASGRLFFIKCVTSEALASFTSSLLSKEGGLPAGNAFTLKSAANLTLARRVILHWEVI